MVSILKIVGVMASGFLVCFGLSKAVQADHVPAPSDVMKTNAQDDRQGFQSDDDKKNVIEHSEIDTKTIKTIKGELFRIQDGNYFVKAKDGKEVRFHVDKTTDVIGKIKKGDHIEVKVNSEHHALSIRPAQ